MKTLGQDIATSYMRLIMCKYVHVYCDRQTADVIIGQVLETSIVTISYVVNINC